VRIELNDGTFYSHVTFIENVVKTWQTFFETHHMEAARPMKKRKETAKVRLTRKTQEVRERKKKEDEAIVKDLRNRLAKLEKES